MSSLRRMIRSCGFSPNGLWLGLLIVSLVVPGTAQRYTFKNYVIEDGLENMAIQALLQDRLGFIWIGTQDGIYRYDGLCH